MIVKHIGADSILRGLIGIKLEETAQYVVVNFAGDLVACDTRDIAPVMFSVYRDSKLLGSSPKWDEAQRLTIHHIGHKASELGTVIADRAAVQFSTYIMGCPATTTEARFSIFYQQYVIRAE